MVDHEEVRGLLAALFESEPSKGMLRRALKELDPDGSGEVTFEEFEQWHTGLLFARELRVGLGGRGAR